MLMYISYVPYVFTFLRLKSFFHLSYYFFFFWGGGGGEGAHTCKTGFWVYAENTLNKQRCEMNIKLRTPQIEISLIMEH